MNEWNNDHPAQVPHGVRVIVRIEPVSGPSNDSPEYVTLGYVCPGHVCWKDDNGKRFSDRNYCVTGWQYLPKP